LETHRRAALRALIDGLNRRRRLTLINQSISKSKASASYVQRVLFSIA